MRILKDPEVRRAEIMDTSERLFVTKGYNQTAIIDILNEIGIAKGTFYYYFKSKEEVMDAIIMRIVSAGAAATKKIADNPSIPAVQTLFQILLAQKPQSGDNKGNLAQHFHQANNAEMHQKSLVQSILHLLPVLAQVLEQGIREKTMATDYPRETGEIPFAAAEVIFDDGFFHWEPDKAMRAPLGQIMYGIIFETFSALVFIPTLFVSAATLLISILTQRIMKNEGELA